MSEMGASAPEAKRNKGSSSPPDSPPTSPRGDPIKNLHPFAFVVKDNKEDAAKKTSEGLADARQYVELMLLEKDGPKVMPCSKCCICASSHTDQ